MSKVNKMKFDKYFKVQINEHLIWYYAVNTELDEALIIQTTTHRQMKVQIAWTATSNSEDATEITKDEFLQAYDQAVEYLIDARP